MVAEATSLTLTKKRKLVGNIGSFGERLPDLAQVSKKPRFPLCEGGAGHSQNFPSTLSNRANEELSRT